MIKIKSKGYKMMFFYFVFHAKTKNENSTEEKEE